ncbi:MAG: hypothetical protein IPK66_02240 [Rhodospirillales bacterium]|nr:hypothetical protein [Rhodospirillales bacterium]
MVDLKKSWVRFRNLPDDVVDTMPEHIRATFLAARQYDFDVELLCPQVNVPGTRRASRRFVLVSDDASEPASGGPLEFDLAALAADVCAARRTFVISTQQSVDIYAAAYAAAVEDLISGYDISLVVETRPAFADAWMRTLLSLGRGGVAGPRETGRGPRKTPSLPRRAESKAQ